jgi:hypothetical protein
MRKIREYWPLNLNNNNNNKKKKKKKKKKKIWKQQTVQVIPIIIAGTGVIPKCLFDSLKTLDLSKNIYINMQKEVIFGTCHLTRKFMSQQQ